MKNRTGIGTRTLQVCCLVLASVVLSAAARDKLERTSSAQKLQNATSPVGKKLSTQNIRYFLKYLRNNSMVTASALEMSTEFFLVPDKSTQKPQTSGGAVVPKRSCPKGSSSCETIVIGPKPIGSFNRTISDSSSSFLREEVWVIPLLVLSCVCMFVMVMFEVFVICKASRTSPSRRHLFLGQMLLLGLFLCSALGVVFSMNPTVITCTAVRFGVGFSYALVFATMLVKCVFLISLNGGVYLPAPYQSLLLLFSVLIQVAVGVQWLINTPPIVNYIPVPGGAKARLGAGGLVVTAGNLEEILSAEEIIVPTCQTPYQDMLLGLLYIVFLILFVAILAVKSRGIRDNYREATYIGLAIGCTIPIWLIWVLSGLVVPPQHQDACLAFGLVVNSAVVFLVMFMPKGRQLAAMGKEGLYVEDREERFSSLSPSGYSPSFFHFKPVKPMFREGSSSPIYKTSLGGHARQWGDMSPQHPLGTPLVESVKSARQTFSFSLGKVTRDRVALVAPPPSYTRMFQYYPYYYYPRYPGGFSRITTALPMQYPSMGYPKSSFSAWGFPPKQFG